MGVGEDIRSMLDGVEAHDAVSLSPVERLLLATDGTVTHMLEALTRGPVGVEILDRALNGDDLSRHVVLRQQHDGSSLAWAWSEVDTSGLDSDVTERLVSGDIGIGHLLREEYAETHRTVIAMEPVWADDAGVPSWVGGERGLYLKRRYKIQSGGETIMEICEWFPKGVC